jgi:hypothetical protein
MCGPYRSKAYEIVKLRKGKTSQRSVLLVII